MALFREGHQDTGFHEGVAKFFKGPKFFYVLILVLVLVFGEHIAKSFDASSNSGLSNPTFDVPQHGIYFRMILRSQGRVAGGKLEEALVPL
jgi:hypothetical protein